MHGGIGEDVHEAKIILHGAGHDGRRPVDDHLGLENNVLRHEKDRHRRIEHHLRRGENRLVEELDARCDANDQVELIEDCQGTEDDRPCAPARRQSQVERSRNLQRQLVIRIYG